MKKQFNSIPFSEIIIGNRRLRLAIALNSNRYQYAVNRKAKRNVVNSILQQIEIAEGRFLEKTSSNMDHLILVSAPVSRLKVSHALRDKLPLNTIQRAKVKLLELFKHGSDDGIYNIINALIFRTCLDQCDQGRGNQVEKFLSKAVCDFLERCIDRGKGWNEKSVHSNSTPIAYIQKGKDSEPENLCFLVNRIMVLASIASEAKISDLNCQIQHTLVENTLKGSIHDDDSVTEYFLVDDLPQNFTEDDCEKLVASLDHE
jgi:hypothetical protein